MNITIEFYGRLRGHFGQDQINCQTDAKNINQLYQQLCQSYQVNNDTTGIKPVINDAFADWGDAFEAGDVLGFLPPASGG